MATGSTSQMSPGQEAGRPQPQTTVEASGGPFIRHSQPGRAPIYNVTGTAFGGIVTQPLVARPGYFRNFRVTQSVTGGTGTGVTYTNIDAPFNLNSLVQVRDAFGTPLVVAGGYEVSNLIQIFSGAFGLNNGTNVQANLPSNINLPSSGNFQISYSLPLEFAKAYGVLSAANASLLPQIIFNLNAVATVMAGSAGSPVVNTSVDTDFYWLPEGVAVEPPGLGTTRQWILQQANPGVGSGGSARIQFPRLGGYLDTVIVEARDSTGARIATAWPTGTTGSGRIQFYLDGVPVIDSTLNEMFDSMAIEFGLTPAQIGWASGATVAGTAANANLTGVMAFTRKNSLNQQNLGLLDTGESYLSTNPGTLLEMNINTAGTISNAPATFSVLVGQIVPTGAIIQGLPEV